MQTCRASIARREAGIVLYQTLQLLGYQRDTIYQEVNINFAYPANSDRSAIQDFFSGQRN